MTPPLNYLLCTLGCPTAQYGASHASPISLLRGKAQNLHGLYEEHPIEQLENAVPWKDSLAMEVCFDLLKCKEGTKHLVHTYQAPSYSALRRPISAHSRVILWLGYVRCRTVTWPQGMSQINLIYSRPTTHCLDYRRLHATCRAKAPAAANCPRLPTPSPEKITDSTCSLSHSFEDIFYWTLLMSPHILQTHRPLRASAGLSSVSTELHHPPKPASSFRPVSTRTHVY